MRGFILSNIFLVGDRMMLFRCTKNINSCGAFYKVEKKVMSKNFQKLRKFDSRTWLNFVKLGNKTQNQATGDASGQSIHGTCIPVIHTRITYA
jgi:hypothetical protein